MATLLVVAVIAHAAPPGSSALGNQVCLGCHGDAHLVPRQARDAPELVERVETTPPRGGVVSRYVDDPLLRSSVHTDLACVDCHAGVTGLPHRGAIPRVDCSRCHYVESLPSPSPGARAPVGLHQRLRERGVKAAPACTNCHGAHDIGPTRDPHSRVVPRHARDDPELVERVGRQGIAETCSACHPRTAADYLQSIHGQALREGNRDVPVCSDCHPEHPRDTKRRLPGIARAGVVATCIACHDDPGLQRRYALPTQRLASYIGSYHGAATALGSSQTANCASCHSAHFILPSSDPRSTVNKQNLPHTCGHCHPGAGVRFAMGSIHLAPSPTHDRAVFWVRVAYLLFIAGLMLSFVGYIGLDLLARLRRRIPGRGPARWGRIASCHLVVGQDYILPVGSQIENLRHRLKICATSEPEFERLTLNQRIQHWALITSFLTLIVTGFPLLFPHSGISRGVVTFLGGTGARAVAHRAAALLLIALVAYHLFYVLFSRRGFLEFRQLIPLPRDARDILHMLGFYFGLTATRPAFDRYNYIEKFEYLAVGWGSVVMITTGILLWSPSFTLAVLPKWAMDIGVVIHGWEAIMAFLAIIIWHMYNVHWNPSVFPMSRIWLTGKIGLHELQENHPLEHERIMARRGRPTCQDARAATNDGSHLSDAPPDNEEDR